MTPIQSIHIRCDIESLDGPFRGELADEQGRTRVFSGWTEFATALMALAGGTDNPSDQQEKPHEEVH